MTTHGKTGSKIYMVWASMLSRCRDNTHTSYHNYGARGISVCVRWATFENFYEDMGEPPFKNAQLDRKDNNSDYSPTNCKWSSKKDQARNRRTNLKITFAGITLCAKEWEEYLKLPLHCIPNRLRRGWSIERALTQIPEKRNV